jgi:hypothetical protein
MNPAVMAAGPEAVPVRTIPQRYGIAASKIALFGPRRSITLPMTWTAKALQTNAAAKMEETEDLLI